MKLPIRINMGTTKPVEVVRQENADSGTNKFDYNKHYVIGERELYVHKVPRKVDTPDYVPYPETEPDYDYDLWVGDEDGIARPVVAGKAKIADAIRTKSLLKVNHGATKGIVGGLWVEEDEDNYEQVTISSRKGTVSTIKTINLDDIKRLVVSDDNFGTDESKVKDPVKGQLFFKI